jgi:hypothetical protein
LAFSYSAVSSVSFFADRCGSKAPDWLPDSKLFANRLVLSRFQFELRGLTELFWMRIHFEFFLATQLTSQALISREPSHCKSVVEDGETSKKKTNNTRTNHIGEDRIPKKAVSDGLTNLFDDPKI